MQTYKIGNSNVRYVFVNAALAADAMANFARNNNDIYQYSVEGWWEDRNSCVGFLLNVFNLSDRFLGTLEPA